MVSWIWIINYYGKVNKKIVLSGKDDIMGEYEIYNLPVTKRDLILLRSALISKETEESSLMNSFRGTNDFNVHYDTLRELEILRDEIEQSISLCK